MLSALVNFSLRYRGVIITLASVLFVYGLYRSINAKFDVFPEFAPPQVVIQTEAPGLSAEEVEQLVTRPVENAVNGVAGLKFIHSQSIQGLSVIFATFEENADIYRSRQMVGERLSELGEQLPLGVKAPTMAPLTSATSMILNIGLTSNKRSLMELRTFADWELRPRLLGVPGVAKAVIFGGEVRQLQIQLRPDRLVAYGIAIEDVVNAARQSTGVRGAGFVENATQRIVIQTAGQSIDPGQLGQAVVAHKDGLSVRLKDVANVLEAPEPKPGAASIGGKEGVIVVVSSQYGANTWDVTLAVERALDEMKPLFNSAAIEVDPRLFRAASFIETALSNIRFSLLLGGVLVSVVLFLFLFNLRTALISITAIPLSLLIAIIILDRLGASLNTLTLGGLAIAIGEVVDDAIIGVENVFRRLRENRGLANPRPVLPVVFDASMEVRGSVSYATFVVALVFLPVITMSGIQGRLFAPLGYAYVLAVLASLAVAMTLTPALCLAFLASEHTKFTEPAFVDKLRQNYRTLLGRIFLRPKLVLGIAAGLCVLALLMLPFFGGAFLPELREGHFIVHMAAVPGTSIPESLRLGREVTDELLKNNHIRSVSQKVGRAEQADDTWGSHYSEFDVDLKPLSGEEAGAVQSEIRNALLKFPGVFFAIKPFLTERIEEVTTGSTGQVVIKIFGDNLDLLDAKAREVSKAVSAVPGAADVQVETQPGMPQMKIRLRPERLLRFGFQPVAVLDAVQTAYQGSLVAQTYQDNRVFGVSVILDDTARREPESVRQLMLRNPDGILIPLRELADVAPANGRSAILHEGTLRRQAVSLNVVGRDVQSFVAEAKEILGKEVAFPRGVYAVFAGAAETQAAAKREILLYSLVAAAAILMLLSIAFRNLRNLLLVLANLPFALVGGVFAIFFSGGLLTVGSLVGLVTLFGISTRNSIMVISHLEHLVFVEGASWSLDTVLRGASERLSPVLMTALVTGLGLLPVAIGSGDPGREIEGPMAIVILGGLLTSTTLNLLVLPTLAVRYGSFEKTAG